MPKNKGNKTGSNEPMSNRSDREFSKQGQSSDQGSHSGRETGGHQGRNPGNIEDDDLTTAGGREGQFSDKNRDKEGQWSPGSSQSKP